MPYSTPVVHRHSPATFTDERGPGAFAPLATLPRRRSKPGPVFHFEDDEDESPEDAHDMRTSPLRLSLNTESLSRPRNHHSPYKQVPFPLTSPQQDQPPPLNPPRPQVSRTESTPILLSTGKPLKSSLKSSSSSPNFPLSPASVVPPRTAHLRARSAPATPNPDLLSTSPTTASTPGPVTPKNVHFAENDGLASVRVFNRSARPASLSQLGPGDDTETETEGEQSSSSTYLRYTPGYPFPRFPSPPLPSHSYQVDDANSSPIPTTFPPPCANIHLESVSLNPRAPSALASISHAPALAGTLLVRNLAYEKHVVVRFTLDDWQTTSEVVARYVSSLSNLPSAITTRQKDAYTPGDAALAISSSSSSSEPWDRFAFTIRLEDYAHNLASRTLWLVARYNSPSVGIGEWWDNNGGSNYRVAFKVTSGSEKPQPHRRTAVSAPAVPSSAPQPPPSPGLQQPQHHPQLSPTALATTQRLSRLSLKNYAAPISPAKVAVPLPSSVSTTAAPINDVQTQTRTPPPTPPGGSPTSETSSNALGLSIASGAESIPTPDSSPVRSVPIPLRKDAMPIMGSGSVGVPSVSPSMSSSPPFVGMGMGFAKGGITLHWPWGRSNNSPPMTTASVNAGVKTNDASSPGLPKSGVGISLAPRAASSPNYALVSSSPPKSPPASASSMKVPSSSPVSSPISIPSASAAPATPLNPASIAGGSSDEELYKAFVRQWCFAQGPPPQVGGSAGGPGIVVG